ncbi:hypothetical protein H2201_007018 [Coniosporium apollinis]|uniref:PLC-like phosphodiesterase n=1 Tax=Coniosporium apollinis TaxID=61459 RepID=A0ABQ9NK96_9PEZI|nr:hypothetical protein H2201_007018 [Coniosporium apollinis]
MLLRALWLSCLLAVARAQSEETTATPSETITGQDGVPTSLDVTYASISTTIVLSTSGSLSPTTTSDGNGTALSTASGSQTTEEVTLLVGGQTTLSSNGTMTSSGATSRTSTSPAPVNTQPCNGHVEFCERKYSNITYVAAHNSPFVRPGSAASNQALPVTSQLNDGIRMLQGQSHFVNNTLYLCHTSCDILNAGTLEDYLRTVTLWVEDHPFDVLTILLGNSDLVSVDNYIAPIQNSGLWRYLYTPPTIPLGLPDWPTLSSMILRQKRVVLFMDYMANQTAVPYILDEFIHIWETPFSPTDPTFPCTVERPPELPEEQARESLMYMANHNLNTALNFMGNEILVPNVALINQTNAVEGPGSLGAMAEDCTDLWGRPPNFLLVDFYDAGSGSVFEVAAELNGVTYDLECCGLTESAAQALRRPDVLLATLVAGIVALLL